MSKVVVLGTGGTIASRNNPEGHAVASDHVSALLDSVCATAPFEVEIESRDLLMVGSYLLTPADQLGIVRAIQAVFCDPSVSGVVVTHGTDTMEETAYLSDLHHADPRPVIFTGAQNTAGKPSSDGPRNLRDAIAVAADRRSHDLGTTIVFDGLLYAAAATRKRHTTALDAFDNGATGPLGRVDTGVLSLLAKPVRPQSLPVPEELPRVDIVAVYPGADRTLLDAAVDAGSRGIVLEATGIGNANMSFVDAARDCIIAGIPVIVATRVANGDIMPRYGNGGGADLAEVGALPAGLLRPSQARVLLAAALAASSPSEVADIIRTHTHLTVVPYTSVNQTGK
ncbi:L-asparaginase [Rhodococcus sp. WMMA185]|uniref:asparaginase n=1 Tax=Rhodococcus sp. WMMA185 TaxID=679318 RepID=UPI0008787132|nr:asparaginase [Rhodococcus sp. WMMA185]AOW93509.1 L-asparaginase [Rhodococcus sp. WMMA185]